MNLRMIDDIYPSMPWDKIDNVVFDIGNVLLGFNPDSLINENVKCDTEMHQQLKQVIFWSPYWMYQDMGVCTCPEARDLMIDSCPELEKEITAVMDNWHALKPVPEGLRALETCRAHGKKTYVLSNYGYDSFEWIDNEYKFFSEFDGKVISGQIKLIKPWPEIYRYLTGKYNCDPSRTLFIDDSHANIAGAITEGWHGLLFNMPGKLDKFLV